MSKSEGSKTTPKTLAKHEHELKSLVEDKEADNAQEHPDRPKKKKHHHHSQHHSEHDPHSSTGTAGKTELGSTVIDVHDSKPNEPKKQRKSSPSGSSSSQPGQARERVSKLLTSAATTTAAARARNGITREALSESSSQDSILNDERSFEPNDFENRGDLRLYNASLILERYSDLFSDFDPRPYSERTISDDFIDEVKKRCHSSRESSDGSERPVLHLMMPEHKRRLEIEDQICIRIRDLFDRLYTKQKRRVRAARIRGAIWVLIGSIILGASVPVEHYKDALSCTPGSESAGAWLLAVAAVLLSPAGWYFFWEGLGFFFFRSAEPASELAVYKRMRNLELMFEGYQKQYHSTEQQALRTVVEGAEDYLRTTFSSPQIVRLSRAFGGERRPSTEFSRRNSSESLRGDSYLDL